MFTLASDNDSCVLVKHLFGNVHKCWVMLSQCVTTICDRVSCCSTCPVLVSRHYAIKKCFLCNQGGKWEYQWAQASVTATRVGSQCTNNPQCKLPNKSIHDKVFIEEENKRICLYRAHSRDEIRHNIEQGSRLELNRGASGRIILAYGKRKNDLQGFYKEIRDKGYYLSINEHNAALFALAVPVISNSNKFVGAIVISGPISRFNDDQKIILLKLLKGQLKNIAMP